MSQVVITLGGITFQSFEVPEKIVVDGGQRLAIHELIGGGRVVDALGDDAGRISFSGIFTGTDAVVRAQILDAAATAGGQVPLYWDGFFYMVTIEEFSVDYEKSWWIPFSVRCVIVVDPAAVIGSDIAAVGDLVTGDVASAIGLSGQAGVSLPLGANPTVSALAGAQSVVSAGLAAASDSLTNAAVSLNGAADAPAGVGSLLSVVGSSAKLAALSSISGFVNRAAVNVAMGLL